MKKENRDLKKLQDELIANKRVLFTKYDRVQVPLSPKHKEHSSHGLETLRMRIIGDVNWMMPNTSPKLKRRDSYNCRINWMRWVTLNLECLKSHHSWDKFEYWKTISIRSWSNTMKHNQYARPTNKLWRDLKRKELDMTINWLQLNVHSKAKNMIMKNCSYWHMMQHMPKNWLKLNSKSMNTRRLL